MPATTEKSWPTTADVDRVMSQLEEAVSAVDEIAGPPSSGYLGLVESMCDPGDPDPIYVVRPGVPQPTYADVGRISVLVDKLRFEASQLRDMAHGLEAVRRAIVPREANDAR